MLRSFKSLAIGVVGLAVAISTAHGGWSIGGPSGPIDPTATFVAAGMCTSDQNNVQFVVEARKAGGDGGLQCSRGGTSTNMMWQTDPDTPFTPPTGGWHDNGTAGVMDMKLELFAGGSGTASANKFLEVN